MKNIQRLVHFASHGPACFAASQQTQPQLCFSVPFQRKYWMQQVSCWLRNSFLELSGDNPKIFFILGSFFTTTSIHTSQLLSLLLTYKTVCGSGLSICPFHKNLLPSSEYWVCAADTFRETAGEAVPSSVHCKIVLLLTLQRILYFFRSRWSKIDFWGAKGTVLCNTK